MNEIEAIAVRLVGADVPVKIAPEAKPGRRSSFRTVSVDDTGPVRLLGYAPNRCRAVLTIIGGAATDTVTVSGSMSDAQSAHGLLALHGQTFYLTGSDEVWVSTTVNANAVNVGIIAEFDS